MKLVSATKLRRAQNAIIQMRPYADKLNGILSNLSDSIESESLKVYYDQREIKNVLLVVITSDRGLCGSFNSNVIKMANRVASEKYAGKKITILPVGKKGAEFFNKQGIYTINSDFRETFLTLSADTAFNLGEFLLKQYTTRKFDVVDIIYNQFKNAATQILTDEVFLPITASKSTQESTADYIFEPSKNEILEELLPRILKTQVYRALLDSAASEHGARMVAMDKATENAGDLLKALKVEYNRARQAAITKEISEIVGGAAALTGK
jgi:F-type H+-transporting ATPase subunit gamma